MTLWESFILGLVQGATEFLPVSSSGHLVMVETVLGVDQAGVVFEVAVHLATLVSILLFYRTRVWDLAKGALGGDAAALRYVGLLVVATIPAGVVGVLWKDAIEGLFEMPAAPAVALLITGAILWSSRGPLASAKGTLPGWGAALVIVPGISRSGTTVVAALWLGIEAREAAAFSFLMAVLAIAGAAVLQIPDLAAVTGPGWGVLLVGGVSAGVTGVLAIRTFVAVLAHRAFHLFAPYCWAVGLLFLAYLGLR
jgi:undecaprenyl-diphosphatase